MEIKQRPEDMPNSEAFNTLAKRKAKDPLLDVRTSVKSLSLNDEQKGNISDEIKPYLLRKDEVFNLNSQSKHYYMKLVKAIVVEKDESRIETLKNFVNSYRENNFLL